MPKIVDHDAYRKELLSQCFDLFAERGYGAITMRQLAENLNVSTGTLYHYFPSKEALFEQLFREMSLQDIQKATVELKTKDTGLERLAAAFDFVVLHEDYFAKQIVIWLEFHQHQSRTKDSKVNIFREVWHESKQEINQLLGLKNPLLVEVLGCCIDGMLINGIFDADDFSLRQQLDLLLAMVRSYLEYQTS